MGQIRKDYPITGVLKLFREIHHVIECVFANLIQEGLPDYWGTVRSILFYGSGVVGATKAHVNRKKRGAESGKLTRLLGEVVLSTYKGIVMNGIRCLASGVSKTRYCDGYF